MRLKRISILFAFVLAFSTFFSSFAFADTPKKNLVALGDSISFGYKLEPNQTQASPNAFPSLIGNGAFNATNLGVPGWTSTQLLAALDTDQFKTPLKTADVITLNIGNNDLMQAVNLAGIIQGGVPVDPTTLIPKAEAASAQLAVNLQGIFGKIRALNQTAPIIFYNLYNPFGVDADPFNAFLHTIGEQITLGVNSNVIALYAAAPGTYIADAYTKYDGHQNDYITKNVDLIHPNLVGHQALASIANDILADLGPLTVTLSQSPSNRTQGPVTISVTTSVKTVKSMSYLLGVKTAADFALENSVAITGNKFDVFGNGTYTVLVVDGQNRKVTATISVQNIIISDPAPGNGGNNPTPTPTPTPDPTPTPTPTPTPAPTPDPTPGDDGSTNPGDDDGTNPGDDEGGENPAPAPGDDDPSTPAPAPSDHDEDGQQLPDTATPIYNYLAIGFGMVLVGFVLMKLPQVRRKDN